MNATMRNFLIFCHLAVPVVFLLTAANLHGYPNYLTWQVVVLLVVGCIPIILPLLAFYVKGIGKDGALFNNVFEGSVSAPDDSDYLEKVETAHTTKKLDGYSKSARKVLRTLWKFQVLQFGDDYSRRWAFGVHPSSLDYPQFHSGYRELNFDGLIRMGSAGMVFLTNEGVDFCKANSEPLLSSADVWDNFVPA
jgi:hypothetical protein